MKNTIMSKLLAPIAAASVMAGSPGCEDQQEGCSPTRSIVYEYAAKVRKAADTEDPKQRAAICNEIEDMEPKATKAYQDDACYTGSALVRSAYNNAHDDLRSNLSPCTNMKNK
jgi:hypothetical protein